MSGPAEARLQALHSRSDGVHGSVYHDVGRKSRSRSIIRSIFTETLRKLSVLLSRVIVSPETGVNNAAYTIETVV